MKSEEVELKKAIDIAQTILDDLINDQRKYQSEEREISNKIALIPFWKKSFFLHKVFRDQATEVKLNFYNDPPLE